MTVMEINAADAAAEELKRQKKAAKKAAKEAAAAAETEAAAAVEAEEEDPAEAKRKRKEAKKAAKLAAAEAEVAAEAEEEDPAEAKRKRKEAKKAAKAKEAEAEAEQEEEKAEAEAPKAKRAKVEKAEPEPQAEQEMDVDAKEEEKPAEEKKHDNENTVLVRGLPWSVDEAVFRKDFTECGEIEKLTLPLNDEGKPRGIAFVKYATTEGMDAALKFDNTDYGGRRIFVSKAVEGGKSKGKGKDKGKSGKDGKSERHKENTVFVRGLPFSVEEETLKKDFAECGEIERLNLPMNEEGKPKGFAFIKFASAEAMEKALKFDETDYGGRKIGVSKAGEGGSSKGKDGKDGKGKGKDAKAKGKGKDGKGKAKGKGKKGGMSSEKMAAKDGAMVESTGEKKTFDDSDDE